MTAQNSTVIFEYNGYHRAALAAVVDGKFVRGQRVPIQDAAVYVLLPIPTGFEFENVNFAYLHDGKLSVSVIYPDSWAYVEAKLREADYDIVVLGENAQPGEFLDIFTPEIRQVFEDLGFPTQFIIREDWIEEFANRGVELPGHAVTWWDVVEYFTSVGIHAEGEWTRCDFNDFYAKVVPSTLEQARSVLEFESRMAKLAEEGIHLVWFGESWKSGYRKVIAFVEGLATFADKATLAKVGAADENALLRHNDKHAAGRFWARVVEHPTRRGTKVGIAHLIAPYTNLGDFLATR